MEVICINNTFNQECLTLYSKYGVKIPEKDKIYSIRTKQKHSNSEWGIRLNEIINPKIPVESSLLPDAWVENTWNLKRFTDLLGNPLLEENTEYLVNKFGYI